MMEKALHMADVQKWGPSVVCGLLPFLYSLLDPVTVTCGVQPPF